MIKSLVLSKFVHAAALICAIALTGGEASAQMFGMPLQDGYDLQAPASPVAEQTAALHHLMLYIITGITIFVLALLLWVIVRYNSAANKTPARFTHNSLVEAVWTIVPVIILIVIAVPSVQLLRAQEDFSKVKPDIVVKATGYQWQWSYQYPELGIEEYFSEMIGYGEPVRTPAVEAQLADAGYPPETFKLATNTALVVPVGKTVVVRVTASDVIHSWAVPAFAVKADGVPARTNDTWFRATQEGVFFGQCSELCGTMHSYMPITVKVVSEAEFEQWAACAKEKGAEECETTSMVEMIAKAQKGADEVQTAQADGDQRVQEQ